MQTSFNLISTAALLQKRWKAILFMVILSMVVAAITVWVVPKYYRSATLVVAANPLLADKARFFNNQIQSLYSYFGSGDDLDRIYSIADMDTTYQKLVDEYNLITYYRLQNDSLPLLRRKAVLQLRKDLSLQKTDKGQLQIIAWTKDKQLSANLVNRMVAIVQETEGTIWKNNYQLLYQNLTGAATVMEQQFKQTSDSLRGASEATMALGNAKLKSLLEQITLYRQSANEYQLAAASVPAVLYVMEPGVPAAKSERPDIPGTLLAAGLLGLLFGMLLVLVADRKNN